LILIIDNKKEPITVSTAKKYLVADATLQKILEMHMYYTYITPSVLFLTLSLQQSLFFSRVNTYFHPPINID